MTIRQLPRLERTSDFAKALEPTKVIQWADNIVQLLTSILNSPGQNGLVGLDQIVGSAGANGSFKIPTTANVIQVNWGQDTIVFGQTTKAVTFAKPFPQTCWVVLISQAGSNGPFTVKSSSPGKTGFTATANNAGVVCSFNYIAIGN